MNTIHKLTSTIVAGLLLTGLVGCSSVTDRMLPPSKQVTEVSSSSPDERFNSFVASHGIPPGNDAKEAALAICDLLDAYPFDVAAELIVSVADKNGISASDIATLVVAGVMSYCPEHEADMNAYSNN